VCKITQLAGLFVIFGALHQTDLMAQSTSPISSTALADVIIHGLQERKAKKIHLIDLRNIGNTLCDYFVVCHGTSSTHAEALADAVEEEVRTNLNEKPSHVEGTGNAEWILMDYFDVVVHVFQESSRAFYNIEDLWADAHITEIEDQD